MTGHHLAGCHAATQRLAELLVRDGLALQVLGGKVVVALGGGFGQELAGCADLGGELRGVVFAAQQVDYAAEARLRAHGQVSRNAGAPEPLLKGGQDALEVGVLAAPSC